MYKHDFAKEIENISVIPFAIRDLLSTWALSFTKHFYKSNFPRYVDKCCGWNFKGICFALHDVLATNVS